VDGDIGTVQSRIDLHCHPKYTSGKKLTVMQLNFVYSGAFAWLPQHSEHGGYAEAGGKNTAPAAF
jgi:hypothetical protein